MFGTGVLHLYNSVTFKGVYIEYALPEKDFKVTSNVSVVPVNTFAYLKCKNFYKSKYIYNHIENQCLDEGTWSSFSPFECEAGNLMPMPETLISVWGND